MTALPKERIEQQQSAPHRLTYMRGSNRFALDILRIKSILGYTEMIPVSAMPAFVRGMVGLNGTRVPVLDMGVRYGYAPSQENAQTCIVVIEINDGNNLRQMGLVVDSIVDTSEETLVDGRTAAPASGDGGDFPQIRSTLSEISPDHATLKKVNHENSR